MSTYLENYIRSNIIQPLEVALQGNNPGVNTDGGKLDLGGKVWYVSEKQGQGQRLTQYMWPYVEEYLFEASERMRGHSFIDETSEQYWQRMGTGFIRDYLRRHGHISIFFESKDLCSTVENWINRHSDESDLYYNRQHLIMAVRDGYNADWAELHEKVIPELKDCPSDYDKVRLEYYCFLDAIIKIALDGGSDHGQKCELWKQLEQSWSTLAAIYSVMTGRIIYSRHNHFSPLISQFKTTLKEYAALMADALRLHPQVLAKGKAVQICKEVEQAAKEIRQNTDLNVLYHILFPETQWKDFDLESPRLSTAEMMQKVRESEELKRLLKQVEDYARMLQTELGNAISMQSLRESFVRLDPSTARVIFAQLDMVLEGNNEAWDRNRLQLKREVNLRYESQQLMIEGTHQQAQLAAGYAKSAAMQPRVISMEGTDVRCEFNGSVGQVIANVEHLESKQ